MSRELDAEVVVIKGICSKCKLSKPINEFGRDKKAASGFKSQCRHCQNEYSKTPEALKRKREYQKRYRPKNRYAVKARLLFRNALRCGYIKKPKYVAGRHWGNNWEFHHANYRKPYAGYWLTVSEHRLFHNGRPLPKNRKFVDYTDTVRKEVFKQWFPPIGS